MSLVKTLFCTKTMLSWDKGYAQQMPIGSQVKCQISSFLFFKIALKPWQSMAFLHQQKNPHGFKTTAPNVSVPSIVLQKYPAPSKSAVRLSHRVFTFGTWLPHSFFHGRVTNTFFTSHNWQAENIQTSTTGQKWTTSSSRSSWKTYQNNTSNCMITLLSWT